MLQIGRALFREGLVEEAKEFFDVAVQQAPDSAEAVALTGYALHRIGDDEQALVALRRALQLDADHVEARIYLANILYDRGEFEAALYHLERTTPEDHWDELGIWRLVELKRQTYRLKDDDPDLAPWLARVDALSPEVDDIDAMLAEIEQRAAEEEERGQRSQLELFGTLLREYAERREEPCHTVVLRDGRRFEGTWEEIVRLMRDASGHSASRSIEEYMASEARRGYSLTGAQIPTGDFEAFVRASANAGLLRIVR
jgi:tetratricopeptide (TPR) repeat protein